MTHTPILLTLDALTVFRLTRLVIDDTIFAPIRDRLIGHTSGRSMDMTGTRITVAQRPRIAEFLSCPWCVSVWLAILIVAFQALLPAICLYVTAVAAFSAISGLLSGLA
jgi:hypothetical protein